MDFVEQAEKERLWIVRMVEIVFIVNHMIQWTVQVNHKQENGKHT